MGADWICLAHYILISDNMSRGSATGAVQKPSYYYVGSFPGILRRTAGSLTASKFYVQMLQTPCNDELVMGGPGDEPSNGAT